MLFIVAGGVAAVINFSSRFFYSVYVSFGEAVILSYLTGMLTAFILMRNFVFERTGHQIKYEIISFSIVNFFAVALTWSISVGLAEYFFPFVGFVWFRYEVAHMIGILFPALSSYFGHKNFTFSNK